MWATSNCLYIVVYFDSLHFPMHPLMQFRRWWLSKECTYDLELGPSIPHSPSHILCFHTPHCVVLLGFLNSCGTLATNWNKVHIRHVAYGRHIQFHMPFAHWIGLSIVMHHGSICKSRILSFQIPKFGVKMQKTLEIKANILFLLWVQAR